MGCAPSIQADAEAASRSKEIDRAIKHDAKNTENLVKLLLLGAGESGKSTIAKQMKILFMNGYTEEERGAFKPVVFGNVVQSMMAIIKAMPMLEIKFASSDAVADTKIIQQISQRFDDFELYGDVGDALKRLWADPGIKECLKHARKYQLNDSAEYYLNELERLCKEEYIPTEQDVLRSRIRTTGIIETTFNYKNLEFHLIDVGGQRSEKKKVDTLF